MHFDICIYVSDIIGIPTSNIWGFCYIFTNYPIESDGKICGDLTVISPTISSTTIISKTTLNSNNTLNFTPLAT